MGLDTVFKSAVTVAFSIFKDVAITCKYSSAATTKTYTPTTGVVGGFPTVYPELKFIFTSYKQSEIDDTHILKTDIKGLLPVSDLYPTPKVNDSITTAAEVVYGVQNISTDPVTAMWIFQLRLRN
jgi:hypothetical protein